MGKRGPKPKGKVKIVWSPDFAYAIGLLATDGNLSPSGRHINFVSKDLEQVRNFQKALGIQMKIGVKARGTGQEKKYFVVQFGDVLFYRFLYSIGITPAKSKTMIAIDIPMPYFFDFLRGVLDGDGYSHSYWDKRWKSSYLFYLGVASAAPRYLEWIQATIERRLGLKGHITKSAGSSCYQLKYAKTEATILLGHIYYSDAVMCLTRKKLKIKASLAIMGRQDRERVSSW